MCHFLYYYTPCEVFAPAGAGGLSLKSKLLQVFSGLVDFSKYSGRS